jgi:hypothetical protein
VGVPAPGAFTVTVAVKVGPLAARLVEVDAFVTVNATALAVVLAVKVAFPEYCAVKEWAPSARLEDVRLACPVPSKVTVPRAVAPSKNWTEPAGVPVPGATAATAAVRVTDWPNTPVPLLGGAVSVVAVLTITVNEDGAEALVPKLGSPKYLAVSV